MRVLQDTHESVSRWIAGGAREGVPGSRRGTCAFAHAEGAGGPWWAGGGLAQAHVYATHESLSWGPPGEDTGGRRPPRPRTPAPGAYKP
jgi:hypothetical protein